MFGSMPWLCLVLQLPASCCTNTALSAVPPLPPTRSTPCRALGSAWHWCASISYFSSLLSASSSDLSPVVSLLSPTTISVPSLCFFMHHSNYSFQFSYILPLPMSQPNPWTPLALLHLCNAQMRPTFIRPQNANRSCLQASHTVSHCLKTTKPCACCLLGLKTS